MTAPDAPTAMTLEEAITLHGFTFWRSPVTSEWACGRIMLLSPHSPTAYSHAWEPHGRGATWPEAASEALGYPVVERDDTAELVEALEFIANVRATEQEVVAVARAALAAYEASRK